MLPQKPTWKNVFSLNNLNFDTFTGELGEFLIESFTQETFDYKKALENAAKKIGVRKPELMLNQQMGTLLVLGLMRGLKKLLESHYDEINANWSNVAKKFKSEAWQELLKEDDITKDFFKHPENYTGFTNFQKHFKAWLVNTCQVPDYAARNIVIRLEKYFIQGLYDEYFENASSYGDLKNAIHKNLFDEAYQIDINWLRYYAHFKGKIAEGLFGETFSLESIFVAPRGYYSIQDENDREERKALDVLKELRDWINSPSKDAPYKVISGGPGSGKTSLVQMFALELMEKSSIRVLYVPLKFIDKDVKEALNTYCKDHYIDHDIKEEKNLLLIFDGLDEIALQGYYEQQQAQNFVDYIKTFFNSERYKRYAIFTGRDLAIQSNFKNDKDKTIHLLSLFEKEIVTNTEKEAYYSNGNIEPENDLKNFLEQDLRQKWWTKYAQITNNGKKFPEIFSNEEISDLTSQPLLIYLFVKYYEYKIKTSGRVDGNVDVNDVYQNLIRMVKQRNKLKLDSNSRDNHEVLKHHDSLNKKDKEDLLKFEKLMQAIAIAIWQGNNRTATAAAIYNWCEHEDLAQALENFANSEASQQEQKMTSLLTQFYFRKIDGKEAGLFEFTHKSFGEYLVAKYLVLTTEKLVQDLNNSDKTLKKCLSIWFDIFKNNPIDHDILRFVTGEVQAVCQKNSSINYQKHIASLLQEALTTGIAVEFAKGTNHWQATARINNCIEGLFVLHSQFATQQNVGKTGADVQISHILPMQGEELQPQYTHTLGNMLHSIGQQSLSSRTLSQSLNHICFTNSVLYLLNFEQADLSRANLSEANLSRANLSRAYLSRADLSGADLSRADLSGAYLSGAYLSRADLSRADLSRADLSGADLSGAYLSGAYLSGAYLSGANLSGAYLSGAYLSGADLSGANLSGADLSPRTIDGTTYHATWKNGQKVLATLGESQWQLEDGSTLDLSQRLP